jgi:hypothetical protein
VVPKWAYKFLEDREGQGDIDRISMRGVVWRGDRRIKRYRLGKSRKGEQRPSGALIVSRTKDSDLTFLYCSARKTNFLENHKSEIPALRHRLISNSLKFQYHAYPCLSFFDFNLSRYRRQIELSVIFTLSPTFSAKPATPIKFPAPIQFLTVHNILFFHFLNV